MFRFLKLAARYRLLSKNWWLFYYLDFFRKKIVYKNLEIAFSNLPKKEKIKIAKNTYKNFATFFEDIILYNTNKKLFDNIKIENEEYFLNALNSKKPIILLGAHFGNWEISSKFLYHKYKIPLAGVMREIKENKAFNKFLKEIRGNSDIKLIDKRNSAKEILKALLKEKRVVGILIDQYTKGKNPVKLTFFKETVFNPAISKLAKTTKAIVIPFFLYKEKNNYVAYFSKPKEFTENDTIESFTKWQAKEIENIIKKYPDQYYWFHNRWK